jgi:signal transduction histidine kinase
LRLSVAFKIFLCFAVVLITFGSVSITAIWRLHRLGADLGVVGESYLPLTRAVVQLESFHKNKEVDVERLLKEKNRTSEQALLFRGTRDYFPNFMRERIREARSVVAGARQTARPSDLGSLGEMDRRLLELSERYGEYQAAAGKLYDTLASAQGSVGGEAEVAKSTERLQRLTRQIDQEVKALSGTLEAQVARRVNEVHRAEVAAAWAIILLTIAAIALGLLATGLAQRLLAPIRVLTDAVKGISQGDFAREVPQVSEDEIGVLAREFNAMAGSLRERDRQLLEQRERLLREQRLAAIGKVSAQITHEIRNPLSSIGLNAELLEDELQAAHFDDPANRQESLALLSSMAHEIDRLTEISEQYLAFARQPRPSGTRVDLNELTGDLVAFLRPELVQARVRVALDLDAELPPVAGDEGQLRQALLNLVRNAKEAMAPTGGELTVRTRALPADEQSPERASLEVRDRGPGISPSALDHLFEPFFSTKAKGTGLGLALTQRIVSDHGGTLECRNDPDGGACFTLTLPADRPAAGESPPARAAAAAH